MTLFLCLGNSWADVEHFVPKEWPQRTDLLPGTRNVKSVPLVDPKKILLPPLHIKLGLMKNMAKALNKNGDGFKYLEAKFPHISEAKLKAKFLLARKLGN